MVQMKNAKKKKQLKVVVTYSDPSDEAIENFNNMFNLLAISSNTEEDTEQSA